MPVRQIQLDERHMLLGSLKGAHHGQGRQQGPRRAGDSLPLAAPRSPASERIDELVEGADQVVSRVASGLARNRPGILQGVAARVGREGVRKRVARSVVVTGVEVACRGADRCVRV